jgi:hypothetical protein
MAIECYECHQNLWCCWDSKKTRWICKRCYMEEGRTYSDWNDLNNANRLWREEKRKRDAYNEFEDLYK